MLSVHHTLAGGWSALGEALRIRTHYAFVIRLGKRGVEITRGGVPPRTLAALCKVIAQCELRSGWIAGIMEDGLRVRLVITDAWPVQVRQRVRNAWAAAG